MTDEPRSFHTDTPTANRIRQQGLGVGQKELLAQRDPMLFDDGIAEEVTRLGRSDTPAQPTAR